MTGRPLPEQIEPAEAGPGRSSPTFGMISSDTALTASGIRREMPRGGVASLAARVRAFFLATPEGPRRLVGALPFDRGEPDFLFQPESFVVEQARPTPRTVPRVASPAAGWLVSAQPSAEAYAAAVARCLEIMTHSQGGEEPVGKVVLSRSLRLTADRPVDPAGLVALLHRDPSVTAFSTPLPDGAGAQRVLVGATPELLVSRKGRSVVSHPLAGSARRNEDPGLDRQAAVALERSEKDRREHRAVVDAVMDALTPYCSDLSAPDGTTLRATASMWHLGTRIVGTLKDPDTPVAELVAALHPTPAVCGLPRERAAQLIADLEGYDRGFYAGAVGWCDAAGDGEWYVSIRSAEIAGNEVRLFAGAGIVAGSDPLAEADETSAKLVALLSALGIDEQGRPLRERAA